MARTGTNGRGVRLHRIMGLLAAVACIVAAITMRSPLMIFFDLTSLFVFVVGTLGLLAITYGRGALELRSAFRAWLLGADGGNKTPKDHLRIAGMAHDFGEFSILMGTIIMNIGHTQMLNNWSDSGKMFPALAVAVLSPLYGLLVHTFIALPLCLHHRRLAGEDESPRLRLLGVISINAGCGLFMWFLVLSDA